MQFTAHAAKTNLPRLIDAALNGEEVVIAKGDKPIVKLVPIEAPRFWIGILDCVDLGEGPDWFEPMNEEDLRLWKSGDEFNR